MTLLELSVSYRDSAELLQVRIRELRAAAREAETAEEARSLLRRVSALLPLLRETRELADLTAHYYDRRYRRNGRYTL